MRCAVEETVGGDAVLPAQMPGACEGPLLERESMLFMAVLDDAVGALRRANSVQYAWQLTNVVNAMAWIDDPWAEETEAAGRVPVSFADVCHVLGLDPEAKRRQLRASFGASDRQHKGWSRGGAMRR